MRQIRETEGRTDLTKLIVAFRNFAKAPKREMFTAVKTLLVLFKIFSTHIY